MLKTRIITAFALGLPVLWLVFGSSDVVFWWFLFVMAVLGMWEWTRLCGLTTNLSRVIGTIVFASLLLAVRWLDIYSYINKQSIFIFFALWWLVAALRVISSPGSIVTLSKVSIVFRFVEGSIVLLGLLLSLHLLHAQPAGPWLVLSLLFLIWGADSFAYFSGRQWGKTKLLPRISPGKTWAGVIGGVFGGSLVSFAVVFWHSVLNPYAWLILPVIVVSTIFSVMGDLFESMYKRQVNLKDSSHLLPGHGGVLDRIDSLLAAAPVFVCGLFLVGVVS